MLKMISELPVGVMRCTDEKFPRVTYMNRKMREYLNIELDSVCTDLLLTNIFFMIPAEGKAGFNELLQQAKEKGDTVNFSCEFVSTRGQRNSVTGGICYSDCEGEEKCFLIGCIVDEKKERAITARDRSYLLALESAYNAIFEVNKKRNAVTCIHGKYTSPIGRMYDVEMTIEGALSFWVNQYILPHEREVAYDFFTRILDTNAIEHEKRPLQAEVSLQLKTGEIQSYLLVVVPLDSNSFLICARDTSKVEYGKDYVLETQGQEEGIFVGGEENRKPKIRTFGYFDIFVDGMPVYFSNAKEKELLALLVDRKGGSLSSEEAITYLWLDEPYSEKVKGRYRKVAMCLKRTLERHGIGHILNNVNGVRSLDVSSVECDYFDYISGKAKDGDGFAGVYMANYSWAEETLALLLRDEV